MTAQTWEVVCVTCKQKRWPYVPEKPERYVCMRCRGGASEKKRASGEKGAAARIARKKDREGAEGL